MFERSMHMRYSRLISLLAFIFMLSGCSLLDAFVEQQAADQVKDKENVQDNANENNQTEAANNYEEAFFVPVQEYKGENFALHPDGDKSLAVINKEREKVEEEVRSYFQENYHTDVTVHNIVGTRNGASAFVEAKGEPYFTGIGIVPVDVSKKDVRYDHLSTIEGQVEDGISAGLYVMAYSEAFENLNELLEQFVEENPVTKRNEEVVTHVSGNGYANPFYFITTLDPRFEELYDIYTEQPDISGEDVREFLENRPFAAEHLIISIRVYMEEQDVDPDEDILTKLVDIVEEAEGIPKGAYSISLHDNNINSRTGSGNKENSLVHEFILKEFKD